MVSDNTSVEKITVEHVTIRSGKPFAAVRTALEALVPRLDDGFLTLLRYGLTDKARQELEGAATLSIFGSRDTARFWQLPDWGVKLSSMTSAIR